jgi:prepilin signal peptidase PulO-like enzyme (type II secretory pathway)
MPANGTPLLFTIATRMMLAALPMPWGSVLAGVAGLVAGSYVTWAVYTLAWNARPISPWARAHPEAPARRRLDRLPVLGWIGMQREAVLHGERFWLRPMVVELLLAAGWAALYWWEVDRQALVAGQVKELLRVALAAPTWPCLATFIAHALLLTFMAAATLIDIDEKTIPDGVTVPGTLLGLVLATLMPMSLLPHVALRTVPAAVGVQIPLPLAPAAQGVSLSVEPLTLAAPSDWPAALNGRPSGLSLAIALSCFVIWCFALTPRILRLRRGWLRGVSVVLARVLRELRRPPLAWIGVAGSVAILGVWDRGGAAWVGLLTALVGMIGGGVLAWSIRVVGSAALRKEAMGFGDVTLMMMIGVYLGWQPSIFVFFIGPFAGLVVGIVQMIVRRDDVIPYGPFLCLGAVIVIVRWADLWNRFQPLFEPWWLTPSVLALGVVMLGAMLVIWRNIKEAIFRYEEVGQ